MDVLLTSSIPVIITEWDSGLVNGKLLKVGAAVPIDLSIKIREDTSLKERIFCEVDTTNNVTRLELGIC